MNEAQMPAADDRDDADLARYREEEEQEVLGILDRCAELGADMMDLETLAANLGVLTQFRNTLKARFA